MYYLLWAKRGGGGGRRKTGQMGGAESMPDDFVYTSNCGNSSGTSLHLRPPHLLSSLHLHKLCVEGWGKAYIHVIRCRRLEIGREREREREREKHLRELPFDENQSPTHHVLYTEKGV